MRRDQKQRIANRLGLVAIPKGGYVSPETEAEIAQEIAQADRMIEREYTKRQDGKK